MLFDSVLLGLQVPLTVQYMNIRVRHIFLDFKVSRLKSIDFGVLEDLKFKIAESSDQN